MKRLSKNISLGASDFVIPIPIIAIYSHSLMPRQENIARFEREKGGWYWL
jgi:hypothetical protein